MKLFVLFSLLPVSDNPVLLRLMTKENAVYGVRSGKEEKAMKVAAEMSRHSLMTEEGMISNMDGGDDFEIM